MYLAHITLFSVLCVMSEQTTFDKGGQNITDITVHPIPGGTTIVRFDHNSITYIQSNHFKNLLNLNEILLNHNAITDIADLAFAQVPMVTRIYLHWNQLIVVREMMFSGLPNLSILLLFQNKIHTVESGSFKGSPALTDLSFGANSLETVPKCMFDPTNHPTSLDNFKMYNNPLRCDQDLCWLKKVDTTWITVYWAFTTECDGPAALVGRRWNTLSEQDLCTTPVSTPCFVPGKCMT